MSTKGFEKLVRLALIPLTAVVLVASGCTSSLTTTTQSNASGGSVFVVGTDAPLASVVSFQVQIESIVLTNSTTTPATMSGNLLASPATVDFARYNGLQGLVDMTDVQPGTYTGVTITLGSASLAYLNIPPPPTPPSTTYTPPTITTLTSSSMPAGVTLTTSTVNLTLNHPLKVNTMGGVPVGLRIDFDLGQSIQPIGGPFTSPVTVDPTFDVSTVARTDTGAHIDEFIGSVTTLPTETGTPPAYSATNSFVITGPHGEPFTINTTGSTEWDGGAALASLNSTSIVAVAGQFDPADQTLDADEVALISDTGFYAGGLVTYVDPSTPATPATSMQFYVRRVLPSGLAAVPLGGLADVTITGKENYGIYWMHNAFTDLLFNDAALTPGQEITVGGADPTASPFDVKRIHLQNWGYEGTIVAGSQNSGQGLFQLQITGFAGQVVPSTVTVYLGPFCDFRYGFGAFSDLSNGAKVRVVGLLLKNSTNGNLVLLGRHIDGLQFTDMTTAAWQ